MLDGERCAGGDLDGVGFAEALARHAVTRPAAAALVDARSEETLTYAGLHAAVARVHALLEREGAGLGEAVLLRGANSLDFAVALIGTILAGRIALPLSTDLRPEEIARVRDHAGARLALTEAPDVPGVRRLPLEAWREACAASPAAPPSGAGALLIYTSGTTGNPKGVLLPHGALAANVRTAVAWLRYGPEHRTLAILPLFHTFSLVSDLLPMLLVGGTCVIAPNFDVQTLASLPATLARWGIRSFSAVPLIFELLRRMRVPLRGGSLAFCISGAAPLAEATRLGFRDVHGVPILPAYGMTEACCFCSISPPDAIVPGSAGVPVVELRVLDDQDLDVPAGVVGELVIRGPNVIRDGYYRDDRPVYVRDGWLRTGDLGRLDASGNLFLTGRKKNMVIRGGEKVYLADIDEVLRRHAGVADAVTVGLLDPLPERIVSFVVPAQAGCDTTEVARWLRSQLGDRRSPDEVRTLEAIPYTRTGKARLAALQTLARQP